MLPLRIFDAEEGVEEEEGSAEGDIMNGEGVLGGKRRLGVRSRSEEG